MLRCAPASARAAPDPVRVAPIARPRLGRRFDSAWKIPPTVAQNTLRMQPDRYRQPDEQDRQRQQNARCNFNDRPRSPGYPGLLPTIGRSDRGRFPSCAIRLPDCATERRGKRHRGLEMKKPRRSGVGDHSKRKFVGDTPRSRECSRRPSTRRRAASSSLAPHRRAELEELALKVFRLVRVRGLAFHDGAAASAVPSAITIASSHGFSSG